MRPKLTEMLLYKMILIVAIVSAGLTGLNSLTGCRSGADEDSAVVSAGLSEGETSMVDAPSEEDCGERFVTVESGGVDAYYEIDRRHGVCFRNDGYRQLAFVPCGLIDIDPADYAMPEGCWQ